MATYQKTKAYEGAEDAKVRPPALDAQCICADGIMRHGYHEPDDGMPRGAAPRIDSGFALEGGINRCTASASRSPAATSRTLRRYRTHARIRVERTARLSASIAVYCATVQYYKCAS
jgi:hypothetical protein